MQRETHTSVFIAAFIIATIWKQSRCPSTVEWIKKMWYITHTHTHTHILHAMKYYSAIKRTKFLPFSVTWMDLEDIMPEVK